MKEALEKGLEALGLTFSPSQVENCLLYLEELSRWNKKMNLVGDREELFLHRHLLDSLAALPVLYALAPKSLADAGSGGGFPGIPLSLGMPEVKVSLIEKSEKKAAFLRHVGALVARDRDLRVIKEDLRQVKETFDLVVTRALADLKKGLQLLWPLTAPGGTLVFYKGTTVRIREEIDSAGALPAPPRVIPLEVPGLQGERHLVIFSRNQ
ncbi:MAG: 16S rRNA (guanine(527)-N(7))-methyltransferase RsmG [Spirochaetales bacterium]|nr:16S rRNA (guanine(527)-N(7))-methyltransferase RsmG [Spirochaetales bacterium]